MAIRDNSVTRLGPATVCKICWHNIYSKEGTTWVTSPAPGIAHTECAEKHPPTPPAP